MTARARHDAPSPEQIEARRTYRNVGMSDEEYAHARASLGRRPNHVETGIFSVMWSEHCSYKNSKPVLRRLPSEGPRVIMGPGEGAGVVDIGDGRAVAFKIESHNHPSAVEPFQGAATGVGGIVRDIFSVGARPVALLDSLRFGPLASPRVRYTFEHVVAGIGSYGNSIGVPTVGGEVQFDPAYEGNPLVNVMCVGLLDADKVQRGVAAGPGNPVLYVGPATGRDGIHGATFASEALGDDAGAQRPAVQVGDPFMEKILMEATLEVIRRGLAVAVQDMGAAGLSGASSEMAHKGGCGMDLDLDAVPQREAGMSAYEIMLSESQERMLLVCREEDVAAATAVFDRWGLTSAVIGRVTDTGRLRLTHRGREVGHVPVAALAEGCPVQRNAQEVPAAYRTNAEVDPLARPEVHDLEDALQRLLASPNVASKAWAYRQYDARVRTATAVPPGSDAAVVLVKGTRKALALSVDCNGRFVDLDPRVGGRLAVAEAARNVVCAGAEPLAVTDNLNFGDPHVPTSFWQLDQAAQGIAEACTVLATPVVSGNVSLYNETRRGAIHPTPVIGMVGLVQDVDHITTQRFDREGDRIISIGTTRAELGGSELHALLHGVHEGRPPEIDLDAERRLQQATLTSIRRGLLRSAHDLAEGGLAVALAESCIAGGIGADVHLDTPLRADVALFAESPSRIVVSVRPGDLPALEAVLRDHEVPFQTLGRVGGDALRVHVDGRRRIAADVARLQAAWRDAIPAAMEGRAP